MNLKRYCKTQPKFFHTNKNEKNRNFYGIEIEADYRTGTDDWRAEQEEFLNEIPPEFEEIFEAKEDGSLRQTGIEFVSQPMTYSYIKKNKNFSDFLRIIKMNCNTFKMEGHGLHLHSNLNLNKERKLVLAKFFKTNFVRIILFISDRENQSINRFASTKDMHKYKPTETDKQNLRQARRFYGQPHARELRHLAVRGEFSTRYHLLNFTTQTIELRFFQATTNLKRILKAIEFFKSVVEFLFKRVEYNRKTFNNYLKFVKNNSKKYNNLNFYLFDNL